jgi:hypothetical protein
MNPLNPNTPSHSPPTHPTCCRRPMAPRPPQPTRVAGYAAPPPPHVDRLLWHGGWPCSSGVGPSTSTPPTRLLRETGGPTAAARQHRLPRPLRLDFASCPFDLRSSTSSMAGYRAREHFTTRLMSHSRAWA